MSEQWVVVMRTGPADDDVVVYGPLNSRDAQQFASFLTIEVDPATPRLLRSPTSELLAWARSKEAGTL